MMSASVWKSIGSTFSSHNTTSCSRGVMPATVGSDKLGNTQFLLRLGRIRSTSQKISGFVGAMRQIFMRFQTLWYRLRKGKSPAASQYSCADQRQEAEQRRKRDPGHRRYGCPDGHQHDVVAVPAVVENV